MENPGCQSDRAAKWNRQLASRVTRWKRLRLTLAILLSVVGIATAFSGSVSTWTVPCFVAAFIAYLLYLDARDQLREVNARKWNAITPRIARVAAPEDKDATKATSSH